MPTLTEIRDGIKTAMDTVANIGTVHTRERTASYAGDMWDVFGYDGTSPSSIRGWQIRLVSTTDASPDLGNSNITHSWEITGIWQVNDEDASELAFDLATELIRTAFRDDDTLGGIIASLVVGDVAGAQMPEHDIAEFAGVLCHICILELNTRIYLP